MFISVNGIQARCFELDVWVSVDELADRMLSDNFFSSDVLHIVHIMSPLVVIVLSIKYKFCTQKRFVQVV